MGILNSKDDADSAASKPMEITSREVATRLATVFKTVQHCSRDHVLTGQFAACSNSLEVKPTSCRQPATCGDGVVAPASLTTLCDNPEASPTKHETTGPR